MGPFAAPVRVPEVHPKTAGVLEDRTAHFESLDESVNEHLWMRLKPNLAVHAIVSLPVERWRRHHAVHLKTFVRQQLKHLGYVPVEDEGSVVGIVRLRSERLTLKYRLRSFNRLKGAVGRSVLQTAVRKAGRTGRDNGPV
jgi:hypothetical protein